MVVLVLVVGTAVVVVEAGLVVVVEATVVVVGAVVVVGLVVVVVPRVVDVSDVVSVEETDDVVLVGTDEDVEVEDGMDPTVGIVVDGTSGGSGGGRRVCRHDPASVNGV